MKKVFVSGCYDIVHGGHVEFFKQAEKKKALCALVGAKYVVLPKSLSFEKISTTELRKRICVGKD